jgi:hypothetical protein
MSIVIPFRDPRPKAMLASRRSYREGCKQLAAAAFAEAFSKSLRVPNISQIYMHDATSIFVAAMRRELKRVARGTGRFRSVRP